MKELKTGISLILLGNLLYLAYIIFGGNATSSVGEFTEGLLVGLSIGINIIGIILSAIYISKNNKDK